MDTLGGMIGDAVDDVGEPGFWIEAIELGGLGQGVEDGGALAAVVGAGEEIILAAQRQGSDGAFGRVVGHLQPAVGGVAGKGGPSGGGVADGAGEGSLAADSPKGLIKEETQVRQEGNRALPPGRQPRLWGPSADLGFDVEQRGNALKRVLGGGGAGGGVDVEELRMAA